MARKVVHAEIKVLKLIQEEQGATYLAHQSHVFIIWGIIITTRIAKIKANDDDMAAGPVAALDAAPSTAVLPALVP